MTKPFKPNYPIAATVDVVIFTIEEDELKVLLIKRANDPYKNHWALPGGFLNHDEPTKAAALRILNNKAGVKDVYLEQLYTFDTLGRDPRGHIITVSYFALVNPDAMRLQKIEDLQTPTFFNIKKLPRLAFDHETIIEYAKKRLAYKLEYTNAAFSLLPKKFTLTQLQNVYETTLDKKIDKRNFRKKYLSLGFIKPIHEKLKGIKQRPAELYSFINKKPIEIKRFF